MLFRGPEAHIHYAKATQLNTDSSWISEAKGLVVKFVAQLLPELPEELEGQSAQYRIVFMARDMDEVLAS